MLIAAGAAAGSANVNISGRQRKRRLSTSTSVAIALSIAVHAAVGVYLYTARFQLHALAVDPEPPPVRLELYEPMRPPPPPPPPLQHDPMPLRDPRPMAIHTPVIPTNITPPDLSPIPQNLTPPTLTGLGVPSLQPSLGEGDGSARIAEPSHVITQPRWLSLPTASQMSAYYPDRAQRMGLRGHALLNCSVDAAGRLHGCSVSGETPPGEGFGDAAQRLSRFFRMAPRTIDGQAVDGGEVTVPFQFTIPDDD